MRNELSALREAWSDETASPGPHLGVRRFWRAVGQCAVTALVVRDLLGGDILRVEIPLYGSHYWNGVPTMGEIDLTREQYPAELDIPRGVVVSRDRLLKGARAVASRTAERYWILLERYKANLERARTT